MIIKKPAADEIPLLQSLWQEAFGDPPEFIESFFQNGYSPERCLVLYVEQTPAAALYWFDCLWEGEKCAYVYGVATAQQYQGKGLCKALMTQLHQTLCKQDYAGAVLVPAKEDLFTLYKKLGYTPFCPTEKQTILPDGTVSVVKTSGLCNVPAGAVTHTREALQFLESYCHFYTGDGFCFWGTVENGTLYIQEFSGDSSLLPAICGAIGAEKTICRVYGSGKDYAMFLPLCDPDFYPRYFGIPLD